MVGGFEEQMDLVKTWLKISKGPNKGNLEDLMLMDFVGRCVMSIATGLVSTPSNLCSKKRCNLIQTISIKKFNNYNIK